MTTVHTPQGEVKLLDPPVELLKAIRFFLPFGAVRYEPPQDGADFGLVMQCGDKEVFGVKQQPVPCDKKQALISWQAHSMLIAHSLAGYLRSGFSGLLLPCAYMRDKGGGQVESGIAYFGFPSARGHESQEYPFEPAYDGVFGHGFTTMMTGFIRALQQSSRDMGISLYQPIGLDVRPRLHLGSIGFGFMLVGPRIICLKTVISEKDPAWTALRASGVTEVYHVPSLPSAIDEDQLPIAKPGR